MKKDWCWSWCRCGRGTLREVWDGGERKSEKKGGENGMKWGQAEQRGPRPSLTACPAASLSVTVASVWWICSRPVKGGYREKCCLSVQWGDVRCVDGELGGRDGIDWHRYRRGPAETLWSTVNWSLWGRRLQPWGGCSTRTCFFFFQQKLQFCCCSL